ncbi:kinesin-like protein KIF11-B [Hippocampus comes]|uniref:kinesin-like protein KIF11-B n=1 Tax=Hippocampus comes TaxID=109280 RepID=UPI00094EE977|nr:PREDICTED: kinesin-like protein KIF11-B [Hippocampus comes]
MASNNPNAVEEETEEVNIRVVVRCSPRKTVMPNASSSHRIVFNTQLKQVIVPRVYNLRAPLQPYTFDEVLAPGTTQLDVYNGIVPPILEDVLNGFKCTIIAYGPMGTGKTFTMVGAWRLDESFTWNEDSRTGIIPRVIHHIFERLSGEDFSIKLSLREINHKKTVDLLRARRRAQLRRLIGGTSRRGQLRGLIGHTSRRGQLRRLTGRTTFLRGCLAKTSPSNCRCAR